MFKTFFLLHRLIYKVLCQKDFEKSLLQRERLRTTQETLQIIVICFYVLKFSKEHNLVKNVSCFLFIALPCLKSTLNHLIH